MQHSQLIDLIVMLQSCYPWMIFKCIAEAINLRCHILNFYPSAYVWEESVA